ncbi:hypothetical protein NDU88_003780 [Pleurodeles waltl]|uniref:Uncharacterized protein n=1 Tax=Pleurodeles waltl TaxID=8319 RepID=A0AAV7V3F0_PLEWA|nr:hypothetical protein NDU88_003780 [Pleurodeles waltl]
MCQFSGPYRLGSPLARSPALPASAASSSVAVVLGALLSLLYVPCVGSPYFRPPFVSRRRVSACCTIALWARSTMLLLEISGPMRGRPHPLSCGATSSVVSPQRCLRASRSPCRGQGGPGAPLGVVFTLADDRSLVCVGHGGGRTPPTQSIGAAGPGLLFGEPLLWRPPTAPACNRSGRCVSAIPAVLARPWFGELRCHVTAGERHCSISRFRRSSSRASAASRCSRPGLLRFTASNRDQPGKLSTPRYPGVPLS